MVTRPKIRGGVDPGVGDGIAHENNPVAGNRLPFQLFIGRLVAVQAGPVLGLGKLEDG